MDSLPDSVITYILCYIPWKQRLNLEQVCRRWRECTSYLDVRTVDMNKDLSRECRLSFADDSFGDSDALSGLFEKQVVPADAVEGFLQWMLVEKRTAKLEKLIIGTPISYRVQVYFSEKVFDLLRHHAENLHHLSAFGYFDCDCSTSISQMRNLRSLCVACWPQLTEIGQSAFMALHLEQLETLERLYCTETLVWYPKRLRVLEIHNVSFDKGSEAVEYFKAENLPLLEKLTVYDLKIRDSFAALKIAFPSLVHLCCVANEMNAWPSIELTKMPELTHVELRRESVAVSVSGLRLSELLALENLTDLRLEFEEVEINKHLLLQLERSNLRSLKLSSVTSVENMTSNQILEIILRSMTMLTSLSLDFSHIYECNVTELLFGHPALRNVALKGAIFHLTSFVNVAASELTVLKLFDVKNDFDKCVYPTGSDYVMESLLARCQVIRSRDPNFRASSDTEEMTIYVENMENSNVVGSNSELGLEFLIFVIGQKRIRWLQDSIG